MEQIHATCVSLNGVGVLLLGDAGAGKSDLALRLIDEGAKLVADDRVDLALEGEQLMAAAPDVLAAKLEVRGVGIVPLATANVETRAPVHLAVRLALATDVARMPEAATQSWLGIPVPVFSLAPFEASATAKVRLLADGQSRGILPLP